MSVYKLKTGDTARRLEVATSLLLKMHSDAGASITSATLNIALDSESLVEREMTVDGTVWVWEWTAQDFLDMPVSATPYSFEILVVFNDSTEATYPSSGTGQILMQDILPGVVVPPVDPTGPVNGQFRFKDGIYLQQYSDEDELWHTRSCVFVDGFDSDGNPARILTDQFDQTGEE